MLSALGIALGLATAAAFANGQTSHQAITLDAVEALPEGALRSFVERDDLRAALLNGTMFPDGGYAVGDPYGEAAHWEPFQDRYLAWILDHCPTPWTGECEQHVAFLLGLRSHGMADQFYDAVFMERSRQVDVDGWASGASMDEATDVALAAAAGPLTSPPRFVPYDTLVPLFAEHGTPVDEATLEEAQFKLAIAIDAVGISSQNPANVERYAAKFPWACAHQVDAEVAGTPAHEAEIVAAYWEQTWRRLLGQETKLGVLAAYPAGSPDSDAPGVSRASSGQVLDAADVRSRLQIVFSRGLDPASLTSGAIAVSRGGAAVPVTLDLFYGRASHVVNVAPVEDWLPNTVYAVTVNPGVRSFDGVEMAEGQTTYFATGGTVPSNRGRCATVPGASWVAAFGFPALFRRRRCR